MSNSDYYFHIDGEKIENNLIELFSLRKNTRNLRYSYLYKCDVLDFVGFIFSQNKLLISLPKHYAEKVELNVLTIEDIELLFNILIKNQMVNNQKYSGDMEEFESNYPFLAFFSVYNYYLKYGLYVESFSYTKPGYSGKISWRDTLKKSSTIISKNSVIYLPLYIKKNKNEQVFISECMIYVINATLKKFPFFVKGSLIDKNISHQTKFDDFSYIALKLKKILSKIFKDTEKILIKSLISFFSDVNFGGDIIFEHYNFELVWEEIVGEYLNDYFVGVSDNKLIFNKEKKNDRIRFVKTKFFVDAANSRNRIEPDHYYVDENNQYIFDSKYYTALSGIDYKQVAYFSFLNSATKTRTKNALLLPTEKKDYSEICFELKDEFYNNKDQKILITSCYLNLKKLMLNYTK